MFVKSPQSHPEGYPREKEVNPTNVETIVQTQEERVQYFLVRRYFINKIHNEMLIEALLRKGTPNVIYDEVMHNLGFEKIMLIKKYNKYYKHNYGEQQFMPLSRSQP